MKFSKLRKKLNVLIVAVSLAIASIGLFAFGDDNINFEISKNLDIYYSLIRELNLYYVDEVDAGKIVKTSIDKMLESLDPYTNYIPESDMEDYRFMTTGQYGGIGALIRKSDKYVVIAEPYENWPAHTDGLKAGDIILEIDGKSTEGKSTEDVSKVLKGQPNTKVKLLIKRPGLEENFEKEITRKEIKIENVPYYGMLDNEIGYICLSQFTSEASSEVKAAFLELREKHNVKKIILDLRGNPGGLLIESVHICNLFMPKGQEVVSTKGKVSQWDKVYQTMFEPIDTEIPVVVVVNRGSASASEIVSGAFQDVDRGVIVGERTFGKGLVQTTRALSYNSQLKVTTAKYYIPSHRCIQALDYSHRNEDGSVGKIPDSLITEFKTKNGRKVYDGGGVLPDIVTDPEIVSNITLSLVLKNHLFDYATQFCLRNEKISSPKEFKISDEEYSKFLEFLKDKDFDYSTRSEDNLKDLIKTAKREKYYSLAENEFNELKVKLAHDKNKDLETFKDEIKKLLAEEIISRYYFQKGRIEAVLTYDKDIMKAIEVLKDTAMYSSILNGTYVPEKKVTETE
jgi:carboxyl-terminal processing protease